MLMLYTQFAVLLATVKLRKSFSEKQLVGLADVRSVYSGPLDQQNMPSGFPEHHSPLDVYLDRPTDIEALTFMDFHQQATHESAEWDGSKPVLGSSKVMTWSFA